VARPARPARPPTSGTRATGIGSAPLPATAEDEESPVLMVRRFGGAAIWVIVALAAVLQNLSHRG